MDASEFTEGFYKRHPSLRRFAPKKVIDKDGGSGSHPEARQSGNDIWLFPKFYKLDSKTQDFVFAHELGHYTLSRHGLSVLVKLAGELGVDLWDQGSLPFGQFNMEEAFADAFASHFLTPSELRSRYPAWVSLVQTLSKTASADRVARRFLAEKLTKQWLMGVRRTWLQLMVPSISDWDDVFKAIKQLDKFVANLRDQIRLVRPGAKRLTDDKFEAKLDKWFDRLEYEIENAKSTARHWREVSESPTPLFRGSFKREDGEKMFGLFRDHFDETTAGYAVIRGGGGRSRPQPLTELVDKILTLLREDAATIRKHDEANPDAPFEPVTAFKVFDLNGMKVVVDDQSLKPGQINEYVKYLDQAHQLLRRKGFGKAWYGEVFIQCKDCGGQNPYGAELGVGGHYKIGPNTVAIFSRPSKYIAELMLHELGHRWWFKHMTRANRLQFEAWIESGLVPVSVYGGKHHHEAFAEAFAWFTLDKAMTSQQVETFKLVALGKRFAASERVVRRFRQSRAIRVDKNRIKSLAQELEAVLAKRLRPGKPLGNQVIVPAAPYETTAVDGTPLFFYVRMQAIETPSPYYVIDGGFGFSTRYQQPIVVVNINGSMPSEDLQRAAKGRQVQNQLYPVLLHEITHAVDKYSKGVGERMTPEQAQNDLGAYYNTPTEVRAYMQEVVDEISQKHWQNFQKAFGPSKGLEYMLKSSPTWVEVSPHWTERNKRLVIKAVVQALNEGESR